MSQEIENELSKYLNHVQTFQNLFLEYLDKDDESCFQYIQNYFDENNILENKQKFITTLCFISKVSSNYHRSSKLMDKIEKVLLYFQPSYGKHCTNIEIFNIFKENKLILLKLFKNKILIPDLEIESIIKSSIYEKRNYPQYFSKEFKNINNEQSNNSSDDFDEKCLIGENDITICKYIRKDDIDQFVAYTNRTNFNLRSNIQSSIFETNSFLLDKTPTIIEYASFFGSLQIVRYLLLNNVTMDESIWLYAVHSKNYELIHLLEEKNVQPPHDSYNEVLTECIKCHHNEIAEYILNNKMMDTLDNNNELKKTLSLDAVRYHNYHYIPKDYEFITNNTCFIVAMSGERYYELVNVLLTMRVGSGILCSCIEATFGDDIKYTLYCAVENNDIEMINVLMSSETFNTYGKSKINRNEIVDQENDKYSYVDNKTALFLAVERSYYDIVKLLLSSKAECNINEESELNCVHEDGYEITKDKYHKLPIHVAVEKGDDEMLELLLTYNKIDVNAELKFVRDYQKPFEYIVNQVEKKTPLQIAVEKGNSNAVRILLSHKNIDVNKQSSFKLDKKLDGYEYDEDNQGNEEEEQSGDRERDKQIRSKKTALHLAVEKNDIEIVKLLLNYSKIDVNKREKYQLIKPLLKIDAQKTALQIAIEKKEIDIVKLLLEQQSISINERIPYRVDREPKRSLCYCEEEESNDKKVESVGYHEYCLKTPLHVAVQTGCIEIIKLLLQQKTINTQIDNGQGKTPEKYTDNLEIKKLLNK